MNIIEFVEHPDLLNDQHLSPAQKTSLKSVYGLPLTDEELKIFKKTTGLTEYPEGKEWSEVTFILGRRSGKSSRIASYIALYEACARDHKFEVGQLATVMIVASEQKRQARICFTHVLRKLEKSKVLRKLLENVITEEIQLTNGVSIQIFPCDPRRIRGQSLICLITDELAMFKVEGLRVDEELLDAARPGLDFPYSKLVKISTPYMMKGEIWNDYRNYFAKANDDVLVFHGSTKLFNPWYSERKLEQLKKRKLLSYEVEHEARFMAGLKAMFDPEVIDRAVDNDRPLEIPPRAGIQYQAFVDVAGGGGKDSYAVACGHREGERIVIDIVRSRAPRFNPQEVTRQYSALLADYGIGKVAGDRYSGDWALNEFAKYGIEFERSEKSKSELYIESESSFNTDQASLPKKELLISQLKNLIRKTRSGGHDQVDTEGAPEDEANVICGLIYILSAKTAGPRPWFWRADQNIEQAQREYEKAYGIIRVGKRRFEDLEDLSNEELRKRLDSMSEEELEELQKHLER